MVFQSSLVHTLGGRLCNVTGSATPLYKMLAVSLPLESGWPCDLHWPIEGSKSDTVPVPNLDL